MSVIEAPVRRSSRAPEPPPPSPPRRRSAWEGGLWELCLVGIGLLIYFLIRGAVVEQGRLALAHAGAIIQREHQLGIFWEPRIQHLLGAQVLQAQVWNQIYFWAHAPLIVVVAIWLYGWHRRQYSLIRNAFLVSALIALAIYWLYPVAPPRLIPGYGFADTMQRYSELSYQAESLTPFVNPYAAMPSLHVGWALLTGVGLSISLRRPLGPLLGALLLLLMAVAVVATANHFLLDEAAGLAVALIGLGAALAWRHVSAED